MIVSDVFQATVLWSGCSSFRVHVVKTVRTGIKFSPITAAIISSSRQTCTVMWTHNDAENIVLSYKASSS